MGPKYVLILDFCVGCLNIIRLTDEELRESENYDDFEDFLITIEGKYGFRLNNCQWMVIENLDIYCYQNGEETELNLSKQDFHASGCKCLILLFNGCKFRIIVFCQSCSVKSNH